MNAGQFKKGMTPWNKGTKGLMPKPANGFKKGQKCWKTRPIGSERKTRDGIEVKTENGWIPRARLVLGGLPPGHIAFHIDGDPCNDAPDNLIAVPRAVAVTLNRWGYKHQPPALRRAIIARALLRQKINAKRPAHPKHLPQPEPLPKTPAKAHAHAA